VTVVAEHIGFRTYKLTTTDFTLNGVSTRLRGVCKHQETEYHATAVSVSELTADWDNLSDLGVNYVRLVHYPHAQLEYDLADQRGIMVWSENGHTNSAAETANGDNINREMVYQNWNHPSIVFGGSGVRRNVRR
jgi:beta-galactosidase